MTPLLEDEYDIHYGDYGYDDGDMTMMTMMRMMT